MLSAAIFWNDPSGQIEPPRLMFLQPPMAESPKFGSQKSQLSTLFSNLHLAHLGSLQFLQAFISGEGLKYYLTGQFTAARHDPLRPLVNPDTHSVQVKPPVAKMVHF